MLYLKCTKSQKKIAAIFIGKLKANFHVNFYTRVSLRFCSVLVTCVSSKSYILGIKSNKCSNIWQFRIGRFITL